LEKVAQSQIHYGAQCCLPQPKYTLAKNYRMTAS
jgi:hypothetical protein